MGSISEIRWFPGFSAVLECTCGNALDGAIKRTAQLTNSFSNFDVATRVDSLYFVDNFVYDTVLAKQLIKTTGVLSFQIRV